MGELANAAKRNSKFLIINKGESATVIYDGFKLIPNPRDPDMEIAQYMFIVDGRVKYWANGNSKNMIFFDTLPKGTTVKITREKWINQDGTEDTNKSKYIPEKI